MTVSTFCDPIILLRTLTYFLFLSNSLFLSQLLSNRRSLTAMLTSTARTPRIVDSNPPQGTFPFFRMLCCVSKHQAGVDIQDSYSGNGRPRTALAYSTTEIDAYIHTYIHTHTYIYTHIYTYIHTYTYTHMHTYIHTHTHNTYIHTYTHTHTYIHTHTYTHMRTYINYRVDNALTK